MYFIHSHFYMFEREKRIDSKNKDGLIENETIAGRIRE
jgi:hypothetical protein